MRSVFIAGAVVCLLAKQLISDYEVILSVIALIASGTFGLAHGGLDWAVAKLWGLRATSRASVYFALGYVACVFLTLVVWHCVAWLACSIFISMSVVHFAGDWRDEMPRLDTYLLGIMLICLPSLAFYPEVSRVLTLLVSSEAAQLMLDGMVYLAEVTSVWLMLKLIMLVWHGRQLGLAAELITLLLIGLLLPPIIYFALYFCGLHAVKHWQTMRAIGLYSRLHHGLYAAFWPTLCCAAAGLTFIACADNTLDYDALLGKTVFIGLAALTVPHWILIEIYGNNVIKLGTSGIRA